ncbi:MAG: TOBE domain-containing protein, partial [Nitrospira sp.]|nr:TOBE domain-containing protein [Nitrospira sp.]
GLTFKVKIPEGYNSVQSRSPEPVKFLAYLRPEDIEILDHPEDGTHLNCFQGRIQQVIFEGSTLRVQVEVAGRVLQTEISGKKRLSLFGKEGLSLYIGFSELTLIRESES